MTRVRFPSPAPAGSPLTPRPPTHPPLTRALARRLLLLALLLLSACGDAPIDRGGIEAFIGQPLPAGTAHLRAVTQAGIDRLVRARFEAPDAEVEAFVRALTGTDLQPGLDAGLVAMGGDLEWWPRALPERHSGAEGHATAANRAFKILAAPSARPRVTTLHLVAFSL